MSDTLDFDLPKHRSSVIKVIGVGGGGSNAVNYMKLQGIRGVDFIVCNTDAQALAHSPVETKIQLGADLTEGLGAGANPQIGEKAALESYEVIQAALQSQTKMVFITAGMGGGTGTGAAPVIAKAARELGILTVGIVTAPFAFEGGLRQRQAEAGVDKLKENVDSLIVINNNKLREVYGNLGFKAGFNKADEVLATAAKGIAEVITHHYNVNIDLRDARTVLHNSGTAIMGSAKASGPDRAMSAVQEALDSPLLNDNHIHGARHVLLLIVSGSGQHEITFDEIGEINDYIQDQAGRQVDIIMGIGEDEHLGDAVQVTVIATGFSASNPVGAIAPAVPETIVYDLDEDKPLNAVPKAPAPKVASGPNAQIDLFDAIEDQPLPEDPKSANRPNMMGLPMAEQPLERTPLPEDAEPVVHHLDEVDADTSVADALHAEGAQEGDDAEASEAHFPLPTLEEDLDAPWETPLAEPSADVFDSEEVAPIDHPAPMPTTEVESFESMTDPIEVHEAEMEKVPTMSMEPLALDTLDNEEDSPAYETPAFDMSHTVEWDFEKPLSGEPANESEEVSIFALDDEDAEEGPSFLWDAHERFDAFSLDAPEDEFIPEFSAPVVPEIHPEVDGLVDDLALGEVGHDVSEEVDILEDLHAEADMSHDFRPAEATLPEREDLTMDAEKTAAASDFDQPEIQAEERSEVANEAQEEERPVRREVSSFNLEDLRALEASLAGHAAPVAENIHADSPTNEAEAAEDISDIVEAPKAITTQVESSFSATEAPVLDPEAALPSSRPEISVEVPRTTGRDESGFELKVVQPAPRGPVSLDPENDPISREQLQRLSAERRAYLQNYNHSFQNTVQALVSEQEWDTPSFERKGMDVAPKAYSKESNLGQTGISGDKKDIEFRAHNSFLHDNVD